MIGKFNTIGKEEEEAVLRVIRSGNLSGYVASKNFAGPEVEALQKEWEQVFLQGEYNPMADNCTEGAAVACNSATSGLLAACMACGIGPMDEVIVPYFTMSATAAAPAVLGAQVILADIDPETLCIDPNDVSGLINENTKAVIVTNMFGHPAKLHQLKSICEGAGIKLIEDNAQAIMAKENGLYTGTIGDIGVFSLNVHKHIQCGEGAICVTKDWNLGYKLLEAINHGENRGGITGLNLRMTEITAAIAREQLKKLPEIVRTRQEIGHSLREALSNWKNVIALPTIRADCEHTFYAVPFFIPDRYDLGESINYLRRSNPIPISIGYAGNLLQMNIKNVWDHPKRVNELVQGSGYRAIHRMGLIETCSYDIKPKHIFQLAAACGGYKLST